MKALVLFALGTAALFGQAQPPQRNKSSRPRP